MARQPLPSNATYVRRLAETLALPRDTLEAVEGLRNLPRAGFVRMFRLAWPGDRGDQRNADYLLLDLGGKAYNLRAAVENLEGCEPGYAVEDLADRITVTLDVEEEDAGGANPNESALAAG